MANAIVRAIVNVKAKDRTNDTVIKFPQGIANGLSKDNDITKLKDSTAKTSLISNIDDSCSKIFKSYDKFHELCSF